MLEFKHSAKENRNIDLPEPEEGVDFYQCDIFDCTVAFEIHIKGFEHESDDEIECRAYDIINTNADLECLGVMMKDKIGLTRLTMADEPFDEDVWKQNKKTVLSVKRKERTLDNFGCVCV